MYNCTKIRPDGDEFFLADGQADKHDEVKMAVFANLPRRLKRKNCENTGNIRICHNRPERIIT